MARELTAVALASLSVAGGTKADPSFRVTVTSTFFRHHVVHIATKPQPNGCVLQTDSDAAQRVVAKTATASVLTLRELLRGATPFALLNAKETRGGSYSFGYNDGCPFLATTPRHVSDTSGCGRVRPFQVLSEFDTVGFIRGTNKFRFTYAKTGGDVFDGTCLEEVFVGEDESHPSAESVAIPPRAWTTAKRKWYTTLDPATLRAGRTVVVRFRGAATFTTPPQGDPAAFDRYVSTDTYTISWTVTLTPVKR